jgi:hypothetical protein
MTAIRWMAVLWPSFLVAAAGEMLFFAFIDPEELMLLGERVTLSRNAIYSIGFFLFWFLAAASSAVTAALMPSEGPRRSG